MIEVYSLEEDKNEFDKESLVEGEPLINILNSDQIILFVDISHKKVWIWQGSNVSARMKFISTQKAPSIRDQYDISFPIKTVDEGEETAEFKVFIGLV